MQYVRLVVDENKHSTEHTAYRGVENDGGIGLDGGEALYM